MKKVLLTLVLCIAIAICLSACSATAPKKEAAASASVEANSNYETRIYEVLGMDCPGCQGGLEKLVRKIESVHSTKANWEKKQLTVIVKSGQTLNDDSIKDAIERANFTFSKRLK